MLFPPNPVALGLLAMASVAPAAFAQTGAPAASELAPQAPLQASTQAPVPAPLQPTASGPTPTPTPSVVITADKLRRGAAATTQSVALRDARQIEEQPAESLQDVISGMANVSITQGLTLRGIPLTGPTGGDGKTATISVDGVSQDGFGQEPTLLSVWDAVGVEVLRGPQSTNQGRNALAGAVVLKTRNPTDHWDLRARATATDPRSHSLAVAGGGPLVDQVLAFRIAAETRRSDGEVYNITRRDSRYDRNDVDTVRAKLRLTPAGTDYQALLTLAAEDRATGNGWVETLQRPARDRITTSNDPWASWNRSRTLGLEQTLPLFGLDWTWQSSWSNHHWHRVNDYDGTELNQGHSSSVSGNHGWSQELRANLDRRIGDLRLRAVAGVYAAQQRLDWNSDFTVPLSYVLTVFGMCPNQTACEALYPSDFVLRGNGDQRTVRNRAVFAESDLDIGDWTLTAGLRHDRERQDRSLLAATSGNTDTARQIITLMRDNGVLAPDGAQPLHTSYQAWLPKLGLAWRFSPVWRAGLTLQRGYRTGGVNYSYQRGANAFGPESTTNYDLSLKGEPSPGLQLALNAYRIDWRNQQVDVGANELDTYTVNAGRSRLHGLELEARWQATPTLQTFGALGLSRSRYLEFKDAVADHAGHQFPRSPRSTASLGLSWKPGPWTVFSEARYEASTFTGADNNPAMVNGAHTVINARISWAASPRLQVHASVQNLFDALYTVYRWQNMPGRESAFLGRGRTVGLGLDVTL